MPAYVAAEKGLFREEGIDATLSTVPLATNIPAALVSGSMQIGLSTTPILLQAREAGIDLVILNGVSKDTKSNPQLSILASKNSGIRTAQDLVGRKIAFPGLKSLFDAAAARWLRINNVDPSKVTFLEAPMPSLIDMLKAGQVDAVAILDPFRGKAIADGAAVKVADFLVEIRDDQPLAFWVATRDFTTSRPRDVEFFRRGWARGVDFIQANPDEARQIGAKYLRGNIIGKFGNFLKGIGPADIEEEVRMVKDMGLIANQPDLNSMFAK